LRGGAGVANSLAMRHAPSSLRRPRKKFISRVSTWPEIQAALPSSAKAVGTKRPSCDATTRLTASRPRTHGSASASLSTICGSATYNSSTSLPFRRSSTPASSAGNTIAGSRAGAGMSARELTMCW